MLILKSRFIFSRKNVLGIYKITHQQFCAKSEKQTPTLPKQPVPKLTETLDKYLKSVAPFLNDSEFRKTIEIVEKFQSKGGIGTQLQTLLEKRAKNTDNWFADWWLKVGYLCYRDPVVINTSPGLVFPFVTFSSQDDRLKFAANIITGALSYKDVIDSGKIKQEKMGKDTLDMNQYKKIFGTCRIPGIKCDHLEFNPQSRHIIIVKNNNFFKLEVIDRCGNIIGMEKLTSNLKRVEEESKEEGPPVGVLTTDNRKNWGRTYQNFILDLTNLKSIREIQTALFLMCLDKPMPRCNDTDKNAASHQTIHGGGSTLNSANRWFDKTVQFIVSEDGINGLTYEHSPAEGGPIAVMTDFIIDYMKNDANKKQEDSEFDGYLEKLNFNIDENLQKAMTTAATNINKFFHRLDIEAFKFKCYGKEFIKSQKLSPDSYLQMAMQYAFYRIHHVPAAHYESAATRKYIHGRTEVIRSCSCESITFAKAMISKSTPDSEKISALKTAIDAHKKYSIDAVNALGVDRHLFGLKMIAIENKIPVPELFSDPSYTRSTYFRLSTSQVAVRCDGFMCYAPAVTDGYGCCYNPRKDDINFAVSAFYENPDGSARKFREALEESLLDMQSVLVSGQSCNK